MTALNFQALAATLDTIARDTWVLLADGRKLGLSMGETTITDINLLNIRREHPELVIHKHTAREEVRTGADWEWWIGADQGWLCLVFQAKRVSREGRYSGLLQKVPSGRRLQVDVLLQSCWDRTLRLDGGVWPIYCFYNSWIERWPRNAPSLIYTDQQLKQHDSIDFPAFGCAIVGAQIVRQVLMNAYFSRRRTLRDTYLPYSRPWSHLFGRDATASRDLEGVAREIAILMDKDAVMQDLPRGVEVAALQVPSGPRELEITSHEVAPTTSPEARRVRLDWQDIGLVRQPPEYVLDLLGRGPRRRRLKPLARRVVVLTERGLLV
jgi:hypothetical protein